jgi:Ca-activated chloride channel family protein
LTRPEYHTSANDDEHGKPRPISWELLTVKVRYKARAKEVSKELSRTLTDVGATLDQMPAHFRFAAAAAAFGMVLRDSPYKGRASASLIRELTGATPNKGVEAEHRAEFVKLVAQAELLAKAKPAK